MRGCCGWQRGCGWRSGYGWPRGCSHDSRGGSGLTASWSGWTRAGLVGRELVWLDASRGGQSADTLQVTQTSRAIGGRRFLYRVDYQAICRHDHTDSSHHEPSHSTTSLTPRRPHSTTPLTPRSPSLHDARFSADSPASWHKFRQIPTFSCCDAGFSADFPASWHEETSSI